MADETGHHLTQTLGCFRTSGINDGLGEIWIVLNVLWGGCQGILHASACMIVDSIFTGLVGFSINVLLR